MPKFEWIARQSGYPRGLVGAAVARVMAWDTREANEAAVHALAPSGEERVLDLGCGHGRTLGLLAVRAPLASITGVDPSAVMLGEARRRNRGAIASGRVRIERGHAAQMPFPAGSFDAALSVHTVYFMPDVAAGLREIRRVLAPGARLLIVHRPADDLSAVAALPRSVYSLCGILELEKLLAEAGFISIRSDDRSDLRTRLAFTIAFAPPVTS